MISTEKLAARLYVAKGGNHIEHARQAIRDALAFQEALAEYSAGLDRALAAQRTFIEENPPPRSDAPDRAAWESALRDCVESARDWR